MFPIEDLFGGPLFRRSSPRFRHLEALESTWRYPNRDLFLSGAYKTPTYVRQWSRLYFYPWGHTPAPLHPTSALPCPCYAHKSQRMGPRPWKCTTGGICWYGNLRCRFGYDPGSLPLASDLILLSTPSLIIRLLGEEYSLSYPPATSFFLVALLAATELVVDQLCSLAGFIVGYPIRLPWT